MNQCLHMSRSACSFQKGHKSPSDSMPEASAEFTASRTPMESHGVTSHWNSLSTMHPKRYSQSQVAPANFKSFEKHESGLLNSLCCLCAPNGTGSNFSTFPPKLRQCSPSFSIHFSGMCRPFFRYLPAISVGIFQLVNSSHRLSIGDDGWSRWGGPAAREVALQQGLAAN